MDVYSDIKFSLDMFGKSWRIAGAICVAHCVLPFLASFILWELILVDQDCGWKSWTKMPVTFAAKWRKFILEKKLYEVYAREDRNTNAETKKKYETDKKKCLDKIEEHDNIVVLSLVVESSTEASFQVTPSQIITIGFIRNQYLLVNTLSSHLLFITQSLSWSSHCWRLLY